MSLEIWIFYASAVLLLTASPGPMVLLCVSTSITSGFKPSMYAAIGGVISISTIITISFTSLGLIISSSDTIFAIVKYVGAGYLIYIGYKALTSKQNNYNLSNTKNIVNDNKSLFIRGLIMGITNPKAIVFFMALFPQFIDLDKPLFLQYIIFVSTFALFEISWLILYSYLGTKSSNWFLQNNRAKFFNKITGGVFIGAGVILSNT
jgi:threonine/homoserine/homoserine lactone efflux protein